MPQDKRQAIKLYRAAAKDSGGTMWVYMPSPGNGAPARVIPVEHSSNQTDKMIQQKLRNQQSVGSTKVWNSSSAQCSTGESDAISCIIAAVYNPQANDLVSRLPSIIARAPKARVIDWSCEAIREVYSDVIPADLDCTKIRPAYRIYATNDQSKYPNEKELLESSFFFSTDKKIPSQPVLSKSEAQNNIGDIFEVSSVNFKRNSFSGRINYSVGTGFIVDVEILFLGS